MAARHARSKLKYDQDVVFRKAEYYYERKQWSGRTNGGSREHLQYLRTCQSWANSYDRNLVAREILDFPKPFESIIETVNLEPEVIRALVGVLTSSSMLQSGTACNERREMSNKVFVKVVNSHLLTSTQNLSKVISNIFRDATSFRIEDIQLLDRITDLLGYLLLTFPSEYICISTCINILYAFNNLDPDTPKLPTQIHTNINDLYEQYKSLRQRKIKKKTVYTKGDQFSNNCFYGDSYRDMPIMPSHDEIFKQGHPKLRYLLKEGAYPTANIYMDVLFKLLREDMLAPLRSGIQHLLTKSDGARKELYMYDKVKNLGIQCSPKHGILYKISFELYGVKNPKKFEWDETKRLRFGSLLCITPMINNLPTFETTLWAVVADTENVAKQSQISIRFSGFEQDFNPDIEYFMVESRSAFYEAYSHTLSVIQQADPEELPMKNIILGQEIKCSYPKYINENTRFNFSEIFPGCEDLRVLGNWPSDTTVLDPSQQKALRLAFTKQVALIQGPPGTGKTYIGVHTMKILLAARKWQESYSWKSSRAANDFKSISSLTEYPILVVAYTNHALDQFLVSLLDYEDNIIRIGSRIEEEILEEKKLYEVRERILKKKDQLPTEIKRARMNSWQIRGRLRQMQNLIERYSLDLTLIHKKTLKKNDIARFATVQQYQSMFEMESDFKHVQVKGKNMCDYWLYGDESITKNREVTKSTQIYVNKYFLDENQFRLLTDLDENSDEESEFFDRESIITSRMENFAIVTYEMESMQSIEPARENSPSKLEKGESITTEEQINQAVIDGEIVTDSQAAPTAKDEYEETRILQRILGQDNDEVDISVDKNYFQNENLKQQSRKSEFETESESEYFSANELSNPDESQIALDEVFSEMDLGSVSDEVELPQHLRTCTNVWELDIQDRFTIYNYWLFKKNMLLNEIIELYSRDYCELSMSLQEERFKIDTFVLKRAAIVGMTTTGAARNSELLKRVEPRVIFVEEAAEVLEAHIISSLSSHLEHLILIGDHQQLRPSNAVYELAIRYNLNLSLFERLVNNKVEHVTLEYQHRMRPEISRLILPIYPSLQDHPVVLNRDFIKGISSNIFFINHLKYEDPIKGDSTTRTNTHEAKFVSKLAIYLTNQDYAEEEITILTFYLGQKYLIEKILEQSRRDTKIRVSTVDKFQGEENTIILFSAVRSNIENNIGYCKVDNRVCVALSRARNGFYMIGNAQCLRAASDHMTSDLWNRVLNNFNGNIGNKLELYCQKHPKTINYAQMPEDFRKVRNGGCNLKCDERMECGHKCELLCHPYSHDKVDCLRPCERVCGSCGHSCTESNGKQMLCYEMCGDCKMIVEKTLPCGHKCTGVCGRDCTTIECQVKSKVLVELNCGHKQSVPCSMANSDISGIRCEEKCHSNLPCGHKCMRVCEHDDNCTMDCQVISDVPTYLICGHKMHIPCFLAKSDTLSLYCKEKCQSKLECGHTCPGTCSSCFRDRIHQPCSRRCNRDLVCGHLCQESCHRPYSCGSCREECRTRCVHGKCTRVCGDTCSYCSSYCEWKCPSYQCQQPCSEPCDRDKCYRRCKFNLECGHLCMGVCGEPCLQVCSICKPDDPAFDNFFGDEKKKGSRFVVLEDCHHVFEMKGLDRWVDGKVRNAVLELPKCPKCSLPIVKNLRYGTLIKSILWSIEEAKANMRCKMQNHLYEQCELMIDKLKRIDHLRIMLQYAQQILELIHLCDNTKLSILRDVLQIFADTYGNTATLWSQEKCHQILLIGTEWIPSRIVSILDSPKFRPGVDDRAISQLNILADKCRFEMLFDLVSTVKDIAKEDIDNFTKLQDKFKNSLSQDVFENSPTLLSSCKHYLNNFFCKYSIQQPPGDTMQITRPMADQ